MGEYNQKITICQPLLAELTFKTLTRCKGMQTLLEEVYNFAKMMWVMQKGITKNICPYISEAKWVS